MVHYVVFNEKECDICEWWIVWSLDDRRCGQMQYLHFWEGVAGDTSLQGHAAMLFRLYLWGQAVFWKIGICSPIDTVYARRTDCNLNLNWCREKYELSSLSGSPCTQFVSQPGHGLSGLIFVWFRLPQLLSVHFPVHCHPVTLHCIVWVDWLHR
jgi:hypothetical protein